MKETIKKILKEESNVQCITKLRTQYSRNISEFYFFKIFVDILTPKGINISVHKKGTFDPIDLNLSIENKEKIKLVNILTISMNSYSSDYYFNSAYLEKVLNEFNNKQINMSMIESTNALIDIFLGLL